MGLIKTVFAKRKNDLVSGLVAYYKLDSNATDSTSNGFNGNIVNASYVTGKINQGVLFNSPTARIDIPDNNLLSFTSGGGVDVPFSISFWLYINSFSSVGNWIINKRDSANNDEWQIVCVSGKIAFQKFSSIPSNYLSARTVNNLALANWYHVVVTDDGRKTNAGMNIYVNGLNQSVVREASGTYTGMINGTNAVRVGRPSWSLVTPDASHQGIIDEIGIWKNKALNILEINKLYNGGNGKSTPF